MKIGKDSKGTKTPSAAPKTRRLELRLKRGLPLGTGGGPGSRGAPSQGDVAQGSNRTVLGAVRARRHDVGPMGGAFIRELGV